MMTYGEQQELKAILGTIFGTSMVANWDMNEDVKELFNRMLADSVRCSNFVDIVPRPTGWIPGRTYLPKEVISAIYRTMNEDKRKIYWLCNEAMKAKYRSMFEMASQGVLH